jgi:hypothetical protein
VTAITAGIESPLDEDDLTYFLSMIEPHGGDAPGMGRWRNNSSSPPPTSPPTPPNTSSSRERRR